MVKEKNRHSQALELWVAQKLLLHGWQIFTPYYDEGFDFVVYKNTPNYGPLLRPIQVRGRTPQESAKLNDPNWGKDDLKLSQRHPELIVVMPFMIHGSFTPTCTAYLPAIDTHVLNVNGNNGKLYTFPTKLINGLPVPNERFERYFDEPGIELLDIPAQVLFPVVASLPKGSEVIITE
jgi:hypothetical protein